jgi:hypothetical protein
MLYRKPLSQDGLADPGVSSVLNLPFEQVALPIPIGFLRMNLSRNKRLDEICRRFNDRFNDMRCRFDSIDQRLERIEAKRKTTATASLVSKNEQLWLTV